MEKLAIQIILTRLKKSTKAVFTGLRHDTLIPIMGSGHASILGGVCIFG